MTVVAHLGPAGTYSEAAALSYVRLASLPHAELRPYATIAMALKAAATGEADLAVVPIENSIQGSVTMTMDGLWQWDRLQIQQALILPIRNALISRAATRDEVRTVYSHPQALAQCQRWLETHLPQAQLVPTHATTEGLAYVKADERAAAIASQRAAALYELPILASPIDDSSDNCTRFLVLQLTAPTTQGGHTSLAFSVKKNLPGALVQPLAEFARRSINLSRIESRPTKRSLGDYIFFADVEAPIARPEMQEAIAAVGSTVETLKLFGSYDIAYADDSLTAPLR